MHALEVRDGKNKEIAPMEAAVQEKSYFIL
jgi:hypothetical protein